MGEFVAATDVTKTHRLAPTTLRLAAGELVAVTGPSLSGKTTLVNLLAGWEQPDAGTIEWLTIAGDRPVWTEIAVVPQSFALLDELTVLENVTLGSTATDPDLDDLLDALDVARLRDRTTAEISVGERQRVMVARALAAHSTIVLADEPVAHQDERHADAVLDQLAAVAAAGDRAVLVATRDAEIAARAQRQLLLEDRD